MIKAKPKPGDKLLVDWSEIAESICRYDLDGLDVHWLEVLNEERDKMGKCGDTFVRIVDKVSTCLSNLFMKGFQIAKFLS